MHYFIFLLEIFAALFGIVSAVFWWRSASRQPTPPYEGGTYLSPKPTNQTSPWKAAWDKAAQDNSLAALLTGAAAAFQGIATLLQAFSAG
jgi:hypothetical protein